MSEISDKQLAQLAFYARMSPADMRQAWVTPRPSPSIGTCLHHWMERLANIETAGKTATSWRYRTGRRGGVRR